VARVGEDGGAKVSGRLGVTRGGARVRVLVGAARRLGLDSGSGLGAGLELGLADASKSTKEVAWLGLELGLAGALE